MSRAKLRRIEYVRCNVFATLPELKAAARRKTMLENKGYSLRHMTATLWTYVREATS